ncbi:hypothetical protein ACKKBG_A34150 [Auxenochlorella protothecoides x Auxenochlorella symbiontica]|uniref:Phosphatidylglycerol/phosphatidylinositol transfer protein n=1 Tax=Auxenochlorella protothecoides TaxID=3075 RepID=A0A087SIS0_AUXPR|nr:Phosphatidylglycerol/phosphatidylinositol transfer protein [Auxenochlorella protothecoides]KFM25624.1 Phosphatidylglycerol/phosphatidylinositol transfer protein [Auxenochlorella protothecoides]RMZ52551.1 hypothetical protein APUTEX25_003694 [Auxenochlorella protothecoides]|eukprot:RMZ52551.1 hypothetical protein APUTEX25_003694 [Auxenochlorella protothecoides]
MVRHSSLAGLLLTLLASRCLAFEWKDCGGAGQGFSLEDVTLTPEPVAPGATAVFNIKATSESPVLAGTINMVVQYAGFPIWTQADDLCTKMTCPSSEGPVSVSFQQQFPVITPPGQYTVTLRGADAAAKPLFCVAVTFQVTPAYDGALDGLEEAKQSMLAEFSRRKLLTT